MNLAQSFFMHPQKRIMDFLKRVWRTLVVIAPLIPYIIPMLISTIVWIATYIFYPNSIAFEIVKDIVLILIPLTVFVLSFHVYRKNMEKRMGSLQQLYGEIKNSLIALEGKFQQLSSMIQQDKQNVSKTLQQINQNMLYYNTLFTKPCPKCNTPIYIDMPSALVKDIHLVDGPPTGRFGVGREKQVVCQSCGEVYHIIYP